MREIKFRAWDKEQNKMMSHEEIDQLDKDGVAHWMDIIKPNNKENMIVMQYTGIKDRNGVEIYEGDIVSNGKTIFVVEWHQQNACFWLNPQSSLVNEEWSLLVINCGPLGNGYYSRKDLNIIGNIHTKTETHVQP